MQMGIIIFRRHSSLLGAAGFDARVQPDSSLSIVIRRWRKKLLGLGLTSLLATTTFTAATTVRPP